VRRLILQMAKAPPTFDFAQSLHKRGMLGDAETQYLRLLDANPADSNCLHFLGLLHAETGRPDTAAQLLRMAIAIEGPRAYLCRNLGIVLEREGDTESALACYRQALAEDEDDRTLWEKCAAIHTALGRYGDSAFCWQCAVELTKPGDRREGALRAHWADALVLRGQREEALVQYVRVLAIDPRIVEATYHRGVALMQLDRTAEALEAFQNTLAREPNHARAANNIGILLQLRKQYAEAIASYRMAVASDPNYSAALYNLGTALHESGEAAEAVNTFRALLKMEPNNAAAWTNLGNAWLAHNEVAAANACYLETLRLMPNEPAAEWNRGIAALLAGDFSDGWAGYERRFEVKGATPRRAFSQPEWRGEPLEGRSLLLHAEQGLGDTIQFVRYAPEFAKRGAKVIVECQFGLISLLRSLPGVSEWIAAPASEPGRSGPQPVDHLPATDFQLPFLSAPHVAQTTLDSIPSAEEYLHAPSEAVQRWSEWLGPRREAIRVGLVWAGNPNHKNDRNRSIPVPHLEGLRSAVGVEWVNLQKGHAPPESMAMRDPAAVLADFADTAGLIANLDLVVSVDTSVAHLAGALGKPVWVLLPFAPDWRWMLYREDSPWYRSARLFRQRAPGAWPDLLREVAAELWRFKL